MFKVKFLLVLALMALVVQDEVKCTDINRSIGSTNKPVLSVPVKSIKAGADSSTDEYINGPLCGTRNSSILPSQRYFAKPGDWPWQVGLKYVRGQNYHYCGATLVTNEWLVTAAHCFPWYSFLKSVAILGDAVQKTHEGTEVRVPVKQVILHPSYRWQSNFNDIALVQLSRKVKFTKNIRPACIPTVSPNSGTLAWFSGWGFETFDGRRSSSPLLFGQVPIVSQASICKEDHGIICARKFGWSVDTCKGYTGGPLVVEKGGKYYLVGVMGRETGCGTPPYRFYTRVTSFLPFIKKYLRIKPT